MQAIDLLRAHLAELTAATGIGGDVHEQGMQLYVVLENVALPARAYAVETTQVLYQTDKQYPVSAMDMFWTDVAVVRADGTIPQNADSIEPHLGRDWRRFSWHRNDSWNPNGNPLLDHYTFMQARFELEPRQDQAA